MKLFNIVGARPQFIKYSSIYNSLKSKSIDDILIHTGQHYDYEMSKMFFDQLGLKKPDYNLGIGSMNHGKMTAMMLEKLEELLIEHKPDAVILYGDTNSTLAGALSASKLHIPVIHIEAGLRSNNKNMPEEQNRILTDHLSTILFSPSCEGVNNLKREGFNNIYNNGEYCSSDFCSDMKLSVNSPLVINIGDIMYDVILNSIKSNKVKNIIDKYKIETKQYFLLTMHRAENTDSKKQLIEILNFIQSINSEKTILFPIHPRTKKMFDKFNIKLNDNIKIISPIGYFDMLSLLENASCLLTDSGGMQKEAYWLGTPCITLRKQTEWVETISNKRNILYKDFKNFNYFQNTYEKTVYGEGKTGELIINILSQIL